jgi:Dolichol-phosphate mannosyltransferase subunit 3 (DPM3)
MLRHVCFAAQLPSYLLIVLGCYALWTIGTDLFFFGDCPDAAKELEKVRGVGWKRAGVFVGLGSGDCGGEGVGCCIECGNSLIRCAGH